MKIDRSFTQAARSPRQSAAIVKAVTGLCDGLDMSTTAEGVETEEQFQALARKGCTETQGFLFSPAREVGPPALLELHGFASELSQAAE